jgi:hypothetical protein
MRRWHEVHDTGLPVPRSAPTFDGGCRVLVTDMDTVSELSRKVRVRNGSVLLNVSLPVVSLGQPDSQPSRNAGGVVSKVRFSSRYSKVNANNLGYQRSNC